ncbi:MAG: hypothetical protein JXC33_01070 [Deltaproteobacteria bacterium]|nr:hypothetical protein [Deltaproteobacteria bacterium]
MEADMERRSFFKGYSLAIFDMFLKELSGFPRNSRMTEDHYFDSFENCYPLLSEAGEMLIDEALNKGINIEGKSKHDIARELFSDREASIK